MAPITLTRDPWQDRNQAERLFDSVNRLREQVVRAIAHPRADKRRLRAALTELERTCAELDSLAFICCPAGIERVALPEGVWLFVPDHERARANTH